MSLKDDICRHHAPMQPPLVHHADPTGVSEPRWVGMMLECSTGELLTSTSMHYSLYQGARRG